MTAAPVPDPGPAEHPGDAGAAGDAADPRQGDGTPVALDDVQLAVVAVAAVVGAWCAEPPPVPLALPVAAVAAAVALRRRRALVLAVAVAVAASALGARAFDSLHPAPSAPLRSAEARLVTDPQTGVAGTTAVAVLDGRRVELWAHGSAGRALRRGWAGDLVTVSGSQRPLPPAEIRRAPWLRVVGVVDVTAVGEPRPGGVVARLANELHRRLDHGARSLPAADRALLAGLVLGDDRDQPAVLRDAFDAVGLSHLLAVSGQNVAFVLTAASPVLGRLRLVARWLAVLALLAFFAVLTRFEPSVLRAVTMAGLAATATALGRPASGLRVLGLAVTLLVLVDPLLVRSLGFQLSVLASAGILLAAPPIARRLPLPPAVAAAVAVPLAAQVATAPLLAARGGGLSLVSLAANVLAEPAAGAVMTWGSSVGLLAGFLPAPVAALATLPERVLLVWIREVALRGARLPPGAVPARWLAVGTAAVAVVLVRRARPAAAVPVAALAAVLALSGGPMPSVRLPVGAELYRAGAVEVLLIGRPLDGTRLLRALRHRIEGPVELVVVTSPSSGAWRAVGDVRARYPVVAVVAPLARPGAVVARPGDRFRVGTIEVAAADGGQASGGRSLAVTVTGADPVGATPPGRDAAGPAP